MTTENPAVSGQFVWHDLMTTDTATAEKFYSDLLSWSVEPVDMGERGIYRMIKAGEKGLGGIIALERGSGKPSHWICYVKVDDIETTCRKIPQHGGAVRYGPVAIPDLGRIAVLEDPTGAHISLFQPDGPMPRRDPSDPPGSFTWYQMNCTEPARAVDFYREIFGWTVESAEMHFGTYWTFYCGGQMEAGMMEAGRMQGLEARPGRSHWLPYVRVSSVDDSTAEAEATGGTVYHPPTAIDEPGGGRFSVIADPTGAAIGLFER